MVLCDKQFFLGDNIKQGGTSMSVRARIMIAAGLASVISMTAPALTAAAESEGQITILYDAFGTDAAMTKDWGFSAFIEVGGKRILFDTGDDADIFAANVKERR